MKHSVQRQANCSDDLNCEQLQANQHAQRHCNHSREQTLHHAVQNPVGHCVRAKAQTHHAKHLRARASALIRYNRVKYVDASMSR
ncbi:MAG: hypothetical protein ACRYGR_01955 [Janthinobacterium lividum]